MRARLFHRERDLDMDREPSPHEQALIRDLGLKTLFEAMAEGDEFLRKAARQAVLSGLRDGPAEIRYRQAVLRDCLRNPSLVRSLYDIAVESAEGRRRGWLGIFSRYPGSILYDAVESLSTFMDLLARLRRLADEHEREFDSEGFRRFFSMLREELTDAYFAEVKDHLKQLRFDRGVLISAGLGDGNAGVDYVLRRPAAPGPGWIRRLLETILQALFPRRFDFTVRISDRDQAGARALSQIRDRGINLVANVAAQSADHIRGFFSALRAELAFYLGAAKAHRRLRAKGVPLCFPDPHPPGSRRRAFSGLREACLALDQEGSVTGNSLEADGRNPVIITGPNQGGKSTFLRSVGLAQAMMQAGMFVAAESFSADAHRGLFTHFKREEDASMKSGRFDEELGRMSAIADALSADSMILFNESFSSTNVREGSEVARQIVRALEEAGVRVFFVTHLYDFARGLWEEKRPGPLFLRAEREPDGRRTFRVKPGEPLPTSHGADVYQRVFGGSEGGNPRE